MEQLNLHLIMEELRSEADIAAHAEPKHLNEKAMSVQLKTSKPTTRFNDDAAAKAAQDALGDQGITASTVLFKDNTSAIRHLFNEVTAVYTYHKNNTLPYIDRGPRLLPVNQYETYRDEMRRLIADVNNKLAAILPNYDTYVQADVDFRNRSAEAAGKQGRASTNDYPTAEQFAASIGLDFHFAPLPDNSHWLFDIDEEDKARLTEQASATYNTALADMRKRIEDPLTKLIEALRVPAGAKDETTGKRLGIFRDTKITNVADAVANVKALSMGDADVLAACELVEKVVSPLVNNPDVLRESPVVREQAHEKLAAVASKMSAFFGG